MTCLAENLSAEHITSSQNPGRRRQRTQRKTGRSHEKTVRNGCRMDDPRPREGAEPRQSQGKCASEPRRGATCHPRGLTAPGFGEGGGRRAPPRDWRGWEWCSRALWQLLIQWKVHSAYDPGIYARELEAHSREVVSARIHGSLIRS